MLAAGVAEHVVPVVIDQRGVQVEAGPALVVERLGHERGQQPVQPGDLLDGRLEPERAVGGVQRGRVPEVDLELPAAELVVGRRHAQPGVAQRAQAADQVPARVALGPDHVHVAGRVRVPPPAALAVVGLQQEVLQLRPDQRPHAQAGQRGLGLPQHHAGRLGVRVALGGVDVADGPGGVRLPRHRGDRAEVGPDQHVGQARVQPAGHRHHVALRAGVEDRAAERQPVTQRGRELVEQHVPPPVHPDHVGVGHPDDVNPLLAQGGDDVLRHQVVVGHGPSHIVWGQTVGRRDSLINPLAAVASCLLTRIACLTSASPVHIVRIQTFLLFRVTAQT